MSLLGIEFVFAEILYSGRTLRTMQNRSAHLRRKQYCIPPLPTSLYVFAHQPIRATELFTCASQGSPKYDVPDLGITAHPYHRLPQLLNSLLIHSDNISALDIYHTLNGKQLQHLREMGQGRYADASRVGGFEASTRRLLEELEDRIRQWELISTHGELHVERERTVYELCIEWGAKVILGMHQELQARNKGYNFYQASYVAGDLAWQNVNLYS